MDEINLNDRTIYLEGDYIDENGVHRDKDGLEVIFADIKNTGQLLGVADDNSTILEEPKVDVQPVKKMAMMATATPSATTTPVNTITTTTLQEGSYSTSVFSQAEMDAGKDGYAGYETVTNDKLDLSYMQVIYKSNYYISDIKYTYSSGSYLIKPYLDTAVPVMSASLGLSGQSNRIILPFLFIPKGDNATDTTFSVTQTVNMFKVYVKNTTTGSPDTGSVIRITTGTYTTNAVYEVSVIYNRLFRATSATTASNITSLNVYMYNQGINSYNPNYTSTMMIPTLAKPVVASRSSNDSFGRKHAFYVKGYREKTDGTLVEDDTLTMPSFNMTAHGWTSPVLSNIVTVNGDNEPQESGVFGVTQGNKGVRIYNTIGTKPISDGGVFATYYNDLTGSYKSKEPPRSYDVGSFVQFRNTTTLPDDYKFKVKTNNLALVVNTNYVNNGDGTYTSTVSGTSYVSLLNTDVSNIGYRYTGDTTSTGFNNRPIDSYIEVQVIAPVVEKDYYVKLYPEYSISPAVNESYFDGLQLKINDSIVEWDTSTTLSVKSTEVDPSRTVTFQLTNIPDIPNVEYVFDDFVLNSANNYTYTREYVYWEEPYTNYLSLEVTVVESDYKADVKVSKGTVTQVLPDGSTGVVSDDTVFSELVFDVNGESAPIDEIVTLIESSNIINPTKDVVIRLTNPDLNNTYKLNGVTLNNDNSYSITASNVQFNITASNTNTYSLDVHKPAEMLTYSVNFNTTVTGYAEGENGELIPDSTVPTNVRVLYNGVEGLNVTLSQQSLTENPTGDVTLAVLDTDDSLYYNIGSDTNLTGFITRVYENVIYKKQPDTISVDIKAIRKYKPPVPFEYDGIITAQSGHYNEDGTISVTGTNNTGVTLTANDTPVSEGVTYTLVGGVGETQKKVTYTVTNPNHSLVYILNGVQLDVTNEYTAEITRTFKNPDEITEPDELILKVLKLYTKPFEQGSQALLAVDYYIANDFIGRNMRATDDLVIILDGKSYSQMEFATVTRKMSYPQPVDVILKLSKKNGKMLYRYNGVTIGNDGVSVTMNFDSMAIQTITIDAIAPKGDDSVTGQIFTFPELSAESISVDGVWLEKVVPGLRIHAATGRELIGYENEEYARPNRDGAVRKSSRIPSRTITVTGQLNSDTPEEFRRRMRLLNHYLHKKDAELIFNDEKNYKFYGTLDSVSEVDPGLLNVLVEFTFLCSDPFKYGENELEITVQPGTWHAVNNYGIGNYISVKSINIKNIASGRLTEIGVERYNAVERNNVIEPTTKIAGVYMKKLDPGESVTWHFEKGTGWSMTPEEAVRGESLKTMGAEFQKNIKSENNIFHAPAGLQATIVLRVATL